MSENNLSIFRFDIFLCYDIFDYPWCVDICNKFSLLNNVGFSAFEGLKGYFCFDGTLYILCLWGVGLRFYNDGWVYFWTESRVFGF